ncbi:MAG: helix-turn-helix transcriptional regulator [Parvibaculum sp.]|uniref:helix-turn-helix transcriptional regulator n=1 Tax=Parvibaculum sp. TaxID=2024848 RepID=UPI0025EBE8AD|nr:helix-turn-helix transcriptional regulator [Parvibaculum sp.]MCE9649712.1 helix-turn-helix transcriptional regulator [Parvibaculum sp.]
MPTANENLLGAYLKDRRAKLDPAAFGFSMARRRTPGLRREEVAQRANVSATWYTWLEQGRGGAPSADVLNRISHAMMLTDTEREHLFLLGLGRPPEVRYRAPQGITPRLQRLLDTLDHSPAFIRTATWDVIAWNRAAAAVLTDYSKLPDGQRNVLRMMFRDARVRAAQPNWRNVARFVVASFRADVARAGAAGIVQSLVDELCATSTEFAAMWRDNDVQAHGDGAKVLHHPDVGPLSMEFSAFAVDGRPDLNMVVYNPATPEDAEKIRTLLKSRT